MTLEGRWWCSAWVSCSAKQLLMRSGHVGVLRAITQGGLYLSDTWELDIRGCLFLFSIVFFLLCSCLFAESLARYDLRMSFSVLSLCPTLVSVVYCAFIKRFATRPKPIPLWHLLFETPGPCSCNSLSTCWREVFVCLFDCSRTFCAMLVFPLRSRRNIIKFLG